MSLFQPPQANRLEQIRENLDRIRDGIEEARLQYNRPPVRMMAVTKTVEPCYVNHAVALGVTLLGENRVQEFLSKREAYDPRAEIHMIGHLQTNKVRSIIPFVTAIESVDSLRLAEEINRISARCNTVTDVFIEVNAGGELSKSGVGFDQVPALLDGIKELANVRIKGLMAIPPIGAPDEIYQRLEECYQRARENHHGMEVLSVGMSGDYAKAIRCGSNLVRIGTALFGNR
ncbi:MAG: YggS family pyridoxal phosphate-dependent enzyme [Oscillospiraceae bacterium]